MRRLYIDGPRRLPTPRGALRRTRLAPVFVALPLVTLLWLTIGLPVFAELSGTEGRGGTMRDFLFDANADAALGGASGPGGGGSEPQTIAAAVVDPRSSARCDWSSGRNGSSSTPLGARASTARRARQRGESSSITGRD